MDKDERDLRWHTIAANIRQEYNMVVTLNLAPRNRILHIPKDLYGIACNSASKMHIKPATEAERTNLAVCKNCVDLFIQDPNLIMRQYNYKF